MHAERLSDAVLVVTGDYFDEHMTLVDTGDGLVVIDTLATLPATREAMPLVEAFSRQPVRVLINTHADIDHVAGNSLFPGAAIVGHANCPARWGVGDSRPAAFLRGFIASLEADQPADPVLAARRDAYLAGYRTLLPGFDEFASAPPFLLVRDGFRLALGGVTIEAAYLGPAHTDTDLVVRVVDENILVTGDVVMGAGFAPVVHGPRGGSLAGLLAALGEIERTADRGIRIVPGHGKAGDLRLIDPVRRYVESLVAAVARAKQCGLSVEAAKQAVHVDEFRSHLLYDLVQPGHVELAWTEGQQV